MAKVEWEGQRLDRLLVLEKRVQPNAGAARHHRFWCRCDCGEEFETTPHWLMARLGKPAACRVCLREPVPANRFDNAAARRFLCAPPPRPEGLTMTALAKKHCRGKPAFKPFRVEGDWG